MKATIFTLLAFVVVMTAGHAIATPDYIGAKKCKLCHKAVFASWSELKHAKAFDLLPEADRGNEQCLSCHATAGSADMPGVQCESCHGPGGGYKSAKIMKDPEARVAAGLITPTEETCKGCHVGAPHDQPPFDYEAARKNGGVHVLEDPK